MTPLARCHEIARKNGSPLFLVSRLFGAPKRRLFIAAYAAMRIVDDLVDERFLRKPDPERPGLRAGVLAQIDGWRRQALAAAAGRFTPDGESFEPLVFTGLNETIGVSDLGPWPWTALARAMEHDVRETEIVTWEDFLDYCEGATVSPAATFAYILGCTFREGRYRLEREPEYCQNHVREMAVFCYLVHIVRDLAKDIRKNAQLVTIPRELLETAGLQRETLAASLDRIDAMETLIRALLRRARPLLESGMPTIQRIPLAPLEGMILKRLLDKYIRLFEQLEAEPTRFL